MDQRGFAGLWRRSPIRNGLLITFVAQTAQGIFVVLFILFVARQLHGGSGEIGLLRGVQAIGAIGAGLALSFTPSAAWAGRLAAAGALAFGLLDLTVWNAPPVTTAIGVYVILFIVVGAPGVVMESGLISVLQIAGEDADRGRVFGAFTLAGNAGQALGMLAAGLLTAPLGLLGLLDAQGCLYLGAGALAAVTLARPASASGRPAGQRLAAEGLQP